MAQEADLAAVFSAAMAADQGVGAAQPSSSPSSKSVPKAGAAGGGRGRGRGAGPGAGRSAGGGGGRGLGGQGRSGNPQEIASVANAVGAAVEAASGDPRRAPKAAPKRVANAKTSPQAVPGHVSASEVVDAFAASARSPGAKQPGPAKKHQTPRSASNSPDSPEEESPSRRPKFWIDPEYAHPNVASPSSSPRSPLRRNLSSPSSGSGSPSPSSSSPRRMLLRREGTGGGAGGSMGQRRLQADSDLERARRAAMLNVSERLLQLTRAQSAKYEWWDDRREAEFLAAEEKARRGNVQKSLDEVVERLYYQNLEKMQERADLNLDYWYNELPSPRPKISDEEGVRLAVRRVYNEARITRRHARAALEERIREEEDEKLQLPEPQYFEKGERKEVVKRRWEKQQIAAQRFQDWRKQEQKEQRKGEKEYLRDNSVHRDVDSTIEELFARTDRLYNDHQKREKALERTRELEAKEDEEAAAELSLHKALSPDKARDRELVHWLHYHDQEARRRRSLRRKHLQEREEEIELQRIASASVHRRAEAARDWNTEAVDDLSERLYLGRDPRVVRVGPWKHRALSWAPPKSAAATRIARQAARQAQERSIRERRRLEAYQTAKDAWHTPRRRGGGWDMALEQIPFEEVLREGWSDESWPQPKRASDFTSRTRQASPAWRSPGIPNSVGESIARRRESQAASHLQAKKGEEMLLHVAHLASRERHRAWQPGANGYLNRVAAMRPRSEVETSDWESSTEGAIDEEMGGILLVDTSGKRQEEFRRATSAVVARAAAMQAWKAAPSSLQEGVTEVRAGMAAKLQ
mmetsp:Transcript_68176/g.142466  ORF Transcript_68176/g.142466 Transcript_68176/m.142466 type:complete len:810 (-) Transcript_68176:72-2501(-)